MQCASVEGSRARYARHAHPWTQMHTYAVMHGSSPPVHLQLICCIRTELKMVKERPAPKIQTPLPESATHWILLAGNALNPNPGPHFRVSMLNSAYQ
jgi:hypothetical protein